MWTAYKRFWTRSGHFKGTTDRSSFWLAYLVDFLIMLVPILLGKLFISSGYSRVLDTIRTKFMSLTGSVIGGTPGQSSTGEVIAKIFESGGGSIIFGFLLFIGVFVYMMASIVPRYAMITRRFHDIGLSGWWVWVAILVNLFVIVLMVWIATHNANALISSIGQVNKQPMTSFFLPKLLQIILFVTVTVVEALPAHSHKLPFRKQYSNFTQPKAKSAEKDGKNVGYSILDGTDSKKKK